MREIPDARRDRGASTTVAQVCTTPMWKRAFGIGRET